MLKPLAVLLVLFLMPGCATAPTPAPSVSASATPSSTSLVGKWQLDDASYDFTASGTSITQLRHPLHTKWLCRKNDRVAGFNFFDLKLMAAASLFKGRHFLPDMSRLPVRWSCRSALSYRDLKALMTERGVSVAHSKSQRWVLKSAPALAQRLRQHLRATNDAWRVAKTASAIQGAWQALERAVASVGNTLDLRLSAKRDGKAAARFFRKRLQAKPGAKPRVSNGDKKAVEPQAREICKAAETLPETTA